MINLHDRPDDHLPFSNRAFYGYKLEQIMARDTYAEYSPTEC